MDNEMAPSEGDAPGGWLARAAAFARHPDFRWHLFFFFAAFFCFGVRPLWAPDEGRYAETARGMVVSGDWLLPRIEGRPHLTKPPFTYWAAGAGMKLFGLNEWGARFFLSWAFFGAILCVVALAKAWGWRREEALMAGLVYSTSAWPFASGHILTTDMFLTLWSTLGILCAWKLIADAPNARRWRWGFWLAFGGAFLTKGPPGWVALAPLAVFLAMRGAEGAWRRFFAIGPFFLFLVVSFGWFAILAAQDHSRLSYWLGNEVRDRLFTNVHKRNNPWYIYPPIIVVGIAPWIFLWPAFLQRVRAKLKSGWRPMGPIEQFSILWFCIPFAAFEAAKSRMPLYMEPLFPPFAIWFGRLAAGSLLPTLRASLPARRVAVAAAAIWAAAMIVFTLYPDYGPKSTSHRGFARALAAELAKMEKPPEQYLWLHDVVRHQISFYIGRVIKPADAQPKHLRREHPKIFAEGGRPLYFAKASKVKKLAKAAPNVKIIARDREFAAFMLPDPPPPAAPSPPAAAPSTAPKE